jgi:hypothetical protein
MYPVLIWKSGKEKYKVLIAMWERSDPAHCVFTAAGSTQRSEALEDENLGYA